MSNSAKWPCPSSQYNRTFDKLVLTPGHGYQCERGVMSMDMSVDLNLRIKMSMDRFIYGMHNKEMNIPSSK